MRFALATLEHGGRGRAALKLGDRYWLIAEAAASQGLTGLDGDLMSCLRSWEECFATLSTLAVSCAAGKVSDALAIAASKARFQTPLQYPSKILCAGANYYDHVAEMGALFNKKPGDQVFFFLKAPTTTLVGPGKTAVMPVDSTMVDWEIELAAIIGKRSRHVPVEKAMDCVAGYAVSVDISARDLLMVPDPAAVFPFNFVQGKSQDAANPLGPDLVPAAFVDDPMNLVMTLSVNGQVKQRASTKGMIFNIAEQVASASRYMTLEPGDILMTGTCAGVGFPHRDFLKEGDKVVATIEQIGTLAFEMLPMACSQAVS
ncbi:MAG: FAA hydrolase family protein [Alphaproteobacteria bacterium]|nr:MAG: FAA hydrolase family protein [Alphaproteobacteria bacterium]